MRRKNMRRIGLTVLLLAAGFGGVALVESGMIDVAVAAPKAARKPAADQPETGAERLSPQVLYLVRSALGALQDANSTGNYSVLRDLAAPSFQARHSAADLAEIFAPARRKPIDLAGAAIGQPVVSTLARPQADRLHVAGVVPASGSAGDRVAFALQFEAVNGHWRLAGINVGAPSSAGP